MVQADIYPIPSCAECGIQSSGKCPSCHRSLCLDHFPLDAHQPCATRASQRAEQMNCYICGDPVKPQQWSTAVFAHYIDGHICAGCHRYVCDAKHAAHQQEDVVIRRDGVRSHRYHMTRRYCPTCSRLRVFGGLIGAGWWLAGAVVLIATIAIVAQITLG
ncbi:MAG TPA: hypothetical protein VE338_08140 [Ktedonobacterales bacterium]|nr:hypothetical protein [Ktedonobacterales bacterium]